MSSIVGTDRLTKTDLRVASVNIQPEMPSTIIAMETVNFPDALNSKACLDFFFFCFPCLVKQLNQ